MTKKLLLCVVAGGLSVAHAGGFDVPDVGTEALGRGGAFVAKADSPLAMYYNVAGLARQRGTRLLLDVNLIFHNIAFTREGAYPGDPNDPRTPWAGKPYPTMNNAAGFGYQPFLALTTDLGFFDRWTFAIGVFSPPGAGTRRYGIKREFVVATKDENDNPVDRPTVRYETDLPPRDIGGWGTPIAGQRAPSPARYDVGEASSTILFPSIAAAVRPVKWLAVGAEFQWVVAQAESVRANLAPSGKSTCGESGDNSYCDSYGHFRATSMAFGFIGSVMAHPTKWLDLGMTVRPEITIVASGTIHPNPVAYSGAQLADFPAQSTIRLPTILRAGARLVKRYSDGTELADVEVDATWENWSRQDAVRLRGRTGDEKTAFKPCADDPMRGCLTIDTITKFRDTFSVRVGGAYNHRLSDLKRLIVRWGAYYDSPTTKVEDTRLDAYSMEKVGFTAGLGLKIRGLTLDLAYAGLWMPDRVVRNSTTVRAGSATNGSEWVEGVDPKLYPANGRYEASIHYVSLGFTVNFDEYSLPSLMPN